MRSGLFNAEGLAKEPPSGFAKITEGSAAVLFPPAKVKDSAGRQRAGHESEQHEAGQSFPRRHNGDGDGGEEDDDGQAVFYNPAQVVNRDLSVCALACFSRLRRDEPRRKGGTRDGITILEALSATGLRAIRYYKEVPGIRFIIANDIDADAVECIRRNCEFNAVPCARPTLTANFPPAGVRVDEATGNIEAGGAVIPNLDDANDLMFRLATNPTVYAGRRLCVVASGVAGRTTASADGSGGDARVEEAQPLLQQELMDVVDLDPYGSASPFLDAAMRCIKEGGLLLVTSTDSAILCGNYPDTCHAKYNTVPSKNAACHEMAVRILLAAMERVANKHRKYIVPLLSLHIDFYVRCFVRVYTQAAEVKLAPCKLGYLLQCSHCPAYWVRPMAVARMRAKKRGRKENTMPSDSRLPKTFGSNNNGSNNNGSSVNNKSSEAKKDEVECTSGALGKECFPAAPLRQDNPKITAFSLQQMPSCADARCCNVCGAFLTLSGPIYAAPTQCVSFLSQLLQEVEQRGAAKQIKAEARVTGLVRLAMEELPETPLFYQLPDIASFVKVRCPPTPLFVGALGRMGFRCSQVHCAPSGIKTDCPPELLVRVMLQWRKMQDETSDDLLKASCASERAPAFGGPAATDAEGAKEVKSGEGRGGGARVPLLEPLAEADFSYDRQFDFRGAVTGVAKFIPNAPNWGPKRRHQGALRPEDDDDDDA
ncbi:putative N(2), N(2)-dimethylguanosine tRNA methyltransferase [Trypanosoma conorhini]|uniref:tRNA (guanine(26)-N(2))-dimethyltransferase n=1 Tax=Trypanosoma conorhini TaxID=83891 RepID=A0A3R7NS10_9TRYP|nr:putative N(2), N(2)-dimethylguanosine tRNA methyltransferase [Trypanosoma conorhini]RNF22554.1 putative N(2), N(2)-dimethylguanosine tRNA methyltransferase [Trypanosoma conorhini]